MLSFGNRSVARVLQLVHRKLVAFYGQLSNQISQLAQRLSPCWHDFFFLSFDFAPGLYSAPRTMYLVEWTHEALVVWPAEEGVMEMFLKVGPRYTT
jgi:hypothetical protein